MSDISELIKSNSREAARNAEYYDSFWKIEEIGIGSFNRLRGQFVKNAIEAHTTCGSSPCKVLDIGCGTGWMSSFVQGRYIGVDFSPKGIRFAKCVYNDFGEFHLADSEDPFLGLQERDFDIVIASEVIEHVRNHEAFIQQIKLFLKDDGLALITTPNGHLLKTFLQKYHKEMQPVENWLSPEELQILLLQNGFHVVSQEGLLFRHPVYGLRAYLISGRLAKMHKCLGLKHVYRRILLRNSIYQLVVSINHKQV